MWKQVNENRWARSDGAVVMWDHRSPHPNPTLPSARMWTAWEPDPSDRYLSRTHRNSVFTSPRRWKTAEAAMLAVDKLFSLEKTPTRKVIHKQIYQRGPFGSTINTTVCGRSRDGADGANKDDKTVTCKFCLKKLARIEEVSRG